MSEVKSPFDIVKAVNAKNDVRDSEGFNKAYTPFIVNKAMANHQQTVLFANEMNQRAHLDKDQQYDFYFHGVPKNPKRFGKWRKKTNEDHVELIQSHYRVNTQRAEQYLKILTPDQIQEIEALYYEGGRAGGGKKRKSK